MKAALCAKWRRILCAPEKAAVCANCVMVALCTREEGSFVLPKCGDDHIAMPALRGSDVISPACPIAWSELCA